MNPSEAADLHMTQARRHHCSSAARKEAEGRSAGGRIQNKSKDIYIYFLFFFIFGRENKYKRVTENPSEFFGNFFF